MSAARRSPRMSHSSAVTAHGEGLLFRKYPLRRPAAHGRDVRRHLVDVGGLFGGTRIYYGTFGRGLFQSVYSAPSFHELLPIAAHAKPWVANRDTS